MVVLLTAGVQLRQSGQTEHNARDLRIVCGGGRGYPGAGFSETDYWAMNRSDRAGESG